VNCYSSEIKDIEYNSTSKIYLLSGDKIKLSDFVKEIVKVDVSA
jgi:hypothetical protein